LVDRAYKERCGRDFPRHAYGEGSAAMMARKLSTLAHRMEDLFFLIREKKKTRSIFTDEKFSIFA
jgi:hypothetical protein